MQLLTVVYIIAMCSVLPLFMQSGYYKLGEAKALCYLLMSLCFFVPFIPLLIKEYKERDLTAKKELSLTYLFFYGTVISSLLSFVFSVDKKTALFGFEGWRNGLLTYLAMLFFCFICTKLRTIPQWGVVAVFIIPAIEFLLGIMDRIGVYLLPIQGRNSGYLATIGNINWYAGFLAIFVPVGIGFMYSKKAFSREFFIWGVYVVLGEMALFLQGSDGAVLIVVASFIMLLLFAVSDRQNMKAFLIQLFVLGLSVTAVGMLTTCFPNSYNYEDNLLLRICQANIGLIMMAAAFFVYRVVRLFEEISVDYKESLYKSVMILLTGIMTTVSIITFVKSFDDSFGNGRGIIWRMSTDIFMGLSPWQKMVGVGQDCLYPYAMRDAFWSSSFSNVFGQDMLTNAHCELLTLLIDRGLIGATTYLGLFFSVLLNLFNAKEKEPAAIICALPLFSYFVFNQTSFAQVMSTPYFFLLIGIAMAITEGRLSGQVGNLD